LSEGGKVAAAVFEWLGVTPQDIFWSFTGGVAKIMFGGNVSPWNAVVSVAGGVLVAIAATEQFYQWTHINRGAIGFFTGMFAMMICAGIGNVIQTWLGRLAGTVGKSGGVPDADRPPPG
jgi:hypothetical protein